MRGKAASIKVQVLTSGCFGLATSFMQRKKTEGEEYHEMPVGVFAGVSYLVNRNRTADSSDWSPLEPRSQGLYQRNLEVAAKDFPLADVQLRPVQKYGVASLCVPGDVRIRQLAQTNERQTRR